MSHIFDKYYGKLLWVILAGILLVFLTRVSCSDRSITGKVSDTLLLRVRIGHYLDKVTVSSSGECVLSDAITGKKIRKRTVLKDVDIIPSSGRGMEVGKDTILVDRIRVTGISGSLITIGGTKYRGSIEIVLTGKGLDIINRVESEDYLKGVLPKEVNPLWPFEAIKAQAIASRSFAVSRVLRNSHKAYDLTDDTYSQVYGGQSAEKWRTNRAVNLTKGKVLTSNDDIIAGYFYSCCGGYTQDISKVWGPSQYVSGVVKCPWCKWSPHFRWQRRMSIKDIKKRFNKSGYNAKEIRDIRPGLRDDSGRLEYVSVKTENGWVDVTGTEFASIMGLKSTNMRIGRYPLFYRFSGYGWGHGVGMCQWGAFGLAFRRWPAEKILEYYYPGTKIKQLKEVL
jgi:stage II sporulation protein D (peptidoglycan lytic transglycosylase)